MDRLSTGEKVAGGSAALLVILSFFPLWAKFEAELEGFQGFAGSTSRFAGWSAATPFVAKLAFILALLALALVVMRAAAVDVDLPFPQGLSLAALGGSATVLLLIALLMGPVGDQGTTDVGGASFEYSRGLAMLIGWLVAAGIAAGGYLHMQQESTPGTGSPLGADPPPGPPTTGGPGPSTGATPDAPGTAPTSPSRPATGPTTPPPAGPPPASSASDEPTPGGTP